MNHSNVVSESLGPLTNREELVEWIVFEDEEILVINKPVGSSVIHLKTDHGQVLWVQ